MQKISRKHLPKNSGMVTKAENAIIKTIIPVELVVYEVIVVLHNASNTCLCNE